MKRSIAVVLFAPSSLGFQSRRAGAVKISEVTELDCPSVAPF